MEIRAIDYEDAQVQALLQFHLAGMHANSPPGAVHALDRGGLDKPGVFFVGAWRDGALMGFGALKELCADHGEIKSMRTAEAFLRQGVGAAILDHLLSLARARRMGRVSLETGSGPAFAPALALYRRRGFVDGPPFGDYAPSKFNQFLHLDLSPDGSATRVSTKPGLTTLGLTTLELTTLGDAT